VNQVLLLLVRESDLEALIVEIHELPQIACRSLVKVRRTR
jgi:hypothetical protein